MPAYIDQSPEQFLNQIHIGNLPVDVTGKQIKALFDRFGIIIRLYFKRRISIDSPISLPNPTVIVSFEKRESVDKIMINRPYYIGDCHLFVRRCIPITRRYPYEAYLSVNKILIRTIREKHDEILPDDNMITDYLKGASGKIVRLERFEEKSVLVEFDDYDPVDICCLSRPHFINDQMIEIEKCIDEQKARCRALLRQKSRSVSLKPSTRSTTTGDTISPTPTLNIDKQCTQLRSTYNELTNRLEYEHEQLIASIRTEWEQIAKERIRLQRLTLDYQQEKERLTEENRQWRQLYDDNLQERSHVQSQGERALLEATEKYSIAKACYDQLDIEES